jgi:hypothetical protein
MSVSDNPDDQAGSPDTAWAERYKGLQRVVTQRDREVAELRDELQRMVTKASEADVYRELYETLGTSMQSATPPEIEDDEPPVRIDPNSPRRSTPIAPPDTVESLKQQLHDSPLPFDKWW